MCDLRLDIYAITVPGYKQTQMMDDGETGETTDDGRWTEGDERQVMDDRKR